jgi:hypothetical protein
VPHLLYAAFARWPNLNFQFAVTSPQSGTFPRVSV